MKRCQGCGKETDLIRGIGPVLLCAQECAPEIETEIEQLRANNQPVDVSILARRRYNRLHDNTVSTERVNRRNDELNAMAQGLGFDGLSQMLTAWKNGEVRLIVERAE